MSNHDHLTTGYQQMMARIKETLTTPATLSLGEHIAHARERAVELGELTEEEAQHIGDYLRRDVEDAAHFLSETQQSLADWLQQDLELIEDRLLDLFSVMVDHTQQELQDLAERARCASEWLSGEISGIGVLICEQCGHRLEFTQPDYIPVCPNCGHTLFKRVASESESDSESLG
ncbi:zinc ribbon-containing protein [Thioflexithrix psekupsensis]|uniref:Zinc ribbon-containing protein n=1 Tax=Thioflexithrix psekupsensis TaxID=1570016 RepID=A0A251X8V5_9GAMM|nr:zinc ribbon-containing protein [Thioflexithrix psekupsensis]OUD14365.1 hypothetical protein TPSD3_08595 [Thioflexithrix psekupsensis]